MFFADFAFRDDVFGLRKSGSRMLVPPVREQVRRLVRFLTCARLWPHFVRLDLSSAPAEVFRVPSCQDALRKMHRLELLILPNIGWETPQERFKLIRQFPEGLVRSELTPQAEEKTGCRGSSAGGPVCSTSSQSTVSTQTAAASAGEDAPLGHAAYEMVKRARNGAYHFRYNGQHYQTTVIRASSSNTEAERIARLLYVRAASGAAWSDIMAYREALYHEVNRL
jgi:hypothetical protein